MSDIHSPLREFRAARALSLDEVSARLGVHKTTVMRIETGELPADADMVERIVVMSDGVVSAADMHAVRLAWLKANRPEKFAGIQPEPAE